MINKNRISWRSTSVLKTIYRAAGEQFELNVEISLGLDLFSLIRLWLVHKFIFLFLTDQVQNLSHLFPRLGRISWTKFEYLSLPLIGSCDYFDFGFTTPNPKRFILHSALCKHDVNANRSP